MLRNVLGLLVPAACWSCGAPARDAGPLCDRCDHELPWLGGSQPPRGVDHLWSALAFDGPARDLVHALKFRRAPGLARCMAIQALAGAPAGLLAPPTAIVPVPAHRLRTRVRGFDHADVLARAIGDVCGRPVVPALYRAGSPLARQRGRGRAARLASTQVVIETRYRSVPRFCVLVDDVHTTGATLASSAAALRAAGAARVSAITYARAL